MKNNEVAAVLLRRALMVGCTAVGLTAASACGGDAIPDRGDVRVAYDFQDSAAIQRATIYMVEGDASSSCNNAPFYADGVAPQARRDLPISGEVTFDSIPRGDYWLAWIVGSDASGTPTAFDCQDFIRVRDGEMTVTSLSGRAQPLRLNGFYVTERMKINFGLDGDTQSILSLADVGCSLFDLDNEIYCELIESVNIIVSDLEVAIEWELSARDEFVNGRFEWTEIQGVPVPSRYRIINGSFTGRVPSTTELEIVSQDLTADVGELIEFIAREVVEVDADDSDIRKIASLADAFSTDLAMSSGRALLNDFDFDWQADSFNGTMDLNVQVPELEQERSLQVPWTATRLDPVQ